VGEYLVCGNSDDCPAQVLGSLKRWVSKVGVLHFGEALLTAVVEADMVSTIGDLYRLDEEAVASLELDGRRVGGAARRAISYLNSKMEIPLDVFVGSLGIPYVGRKMVKVLVEAGYDDLTKMASVTVDEMSAVPGFGEGRAVNFRKGFDSRATLMADIVSAGVVVVLPEVIEATSNLMEGAAVCMTGFRDPSMVEAIVAAGGKIASGVSKNTTILVAKDPTSTSGKAKKARALGLDIVGPDEMWARLGGRA
jgi:DNA ligase (NAD+)